MNAERRWVMVPIDEAGRGRRALGTARDLALGLGAGIKLMCVVEGDSHHIDGLLTELAAHVTEVPTGVEIVANKDVASAIVEAAGDDSVVCMSTAGSLLPHAGHFGSIAEEVVRRMDRPVVLIGPNADPSLTRELCRVIVPVDGSQRSEAAIGPASILAELLDLPVWVVTVVAAAEQRAFAAEMGSGAVAAESGYVRLLARNATKEHGVDAQYDVLHGEHPADSILEFASPDGVVVMTTHGRSGLARLFAGSTATAVVARSAHPVFVVRNKDDLVDD